MLKITKIYPRDLIAVIVLLSAFILKGMGVNTYLDIVIAVVVGYYFGRRIDTEIVNNQKPMTAAFGEFKKPVVPSKVETQTTGDFNPTPAPIHPNLPTQASPPAQFPAPVST